MAPPL